MGKVSSLFKYTLTHYLVGLPIPSSFTGWFKLGFKDWLQLVLPTAFLAGLSYIAFCLEACPGLRFRCSKRVRLEELEVVYMVDLEDIAEKAAFC